MKKHDPSDMARSRARKRGDYNGKITRYGIMLKSGGWMMDEHNPGFAREFQTAFEAFKVMPNGSQLVPVISHKSAYINQSRYAGGLDHVESK